MAQVNVNDVELSITGVDVKSPTAEEVDKFHDAVSSGIANYLASEESTRIPPATWEESVFNKPLKAAAERVVSQQLVGHDSLFRYCGTIPDDDWVKRVERLNAEIDRLRALLTEEQGDERHVLSIDDQLRMLAKRDE